MLASFCKLSLPDENGEQSYIIEELVHASSEDPEALTDAALDALRDFDARISRYHKT